MYHIFAIKRAVAVGSGSTPSPNFSRFPTNTMTNIPVEPLPRSKIPARPLPRPQGETALDAEVAGEGDRRRSQAACRCPTYCFQKFIAHQWWPFCKSGRTGIWKRLNRNEGRCRAGTGSGRAAFFLRGRGRAVADTNRSTPAGGDKPGAAGGAPQTLPIKRVSGSLRGPALSIYYVLRSTS